MGFFEIIISSFSIVQNESSFGVDSWKIIVGKSRRKWRKNTTNFKRNPFALAYTFLNFFLLFRKVCSFSLVAPIHFFFTNQNAETWKLWLFKKLWFSLSVWELKFSLIQAKTCIWIFFNELVSEKWQVSVVFGEYMSCFCCESCCAFHIPFSLFTIFGWSLNWMKPSPRRKTICKAFISPHQPPNEIPNQKQHWFPTRLSRQVPKNQLAKQITAS